jgi:hypothetical protein
MAERQLTEIFAMLPQMVAKGRGTHQEIMSLISGEDPYVPDMPDITPKFSSVSDFDKGMIFSGGDFPFANKFAFSSAMSTMSEKKEEEDRALLKQAIEEGKFSTEAISMLPWNLHTNPIEDAAAVNIQQLIKESGGSNDKMDLTTFADTYGVGLEELNSKVYEGNTSLTPEGVIAEMQHKTPMLSGDYSAPIPMGQDLSPITAFEEDEVLEILANGVILKDSKNISKNLEPMFEMSVRPTGPITQQLPTEKYYPHPEHGIATPAAMFNHVKFYWAPEKQTVFGQASIDIDGQAIEPVWMRFVLESPAEDNSFNFAGRDWTYDDKVVETQYPIGQKIEQYSSKEDLNRKLEEASGSAGILSKDRINDLSNEFGQPLASMVSRFAHDPRGLWEAISVGKLGDRAEIPQWRRTIMQGYRQALGEYLLTKEAATMPFGEFLLIKARDRKTGKSTLTSNLKETLEYSRRGESAPTVFGGESVGFNTDADRNKRDTINMIIAANSINPDSYKGNILVNNIADQYDLYQIRREIKGGTGPGFFAHYHDRRTGFSPEVKGPQGSVIKSEEAKPKQIFELPPSTPSVGLDEKQLGNMYSNI